MRHTFRPGSDLCRNAQLASGLSAAARRNCQAAGTSAASAPVGHYGFDVHIDSLEEEERP